MERQSEVHRFFPEWADRPASTDSLFEADHNSYLAGGYSEEFGYRLGSDLTSVFPLLYGDPEHNRQWTVQINGLHPGYPECPRPADRGAPVAIGSVGAPDRSNRSEGARPRPGATHIVWVNRNGPARHSVLAISISVLRARLRIRRRVRDPGI